MDGNFSLAPKHFQQLYVIRVAVHDIFVTTVYALLQCKTQTTYENMLHAIMGECAARQLYPDPQTINMDFEKAMILAAKGVLGEHIVIRGCFYHLTQSTHRKIQVLGLQTTYRENEAFNLFCGMLDGLAFLPVEDVLQGIDYLRTVMPAEATDLVDYFDTTYVHGSFRRIGNPNATGPLRFRNIAPMFPPETWNVNMTTIAGEERTNNRVEGWNHRFSNIVGHDHPVVWTLIKKMRLEEAADQTKLQQYRLGVLTKKTKLGVYANMQKRLKALCEEYRNGTRTLEDFIRAIGHTIRFR